jgi:hypothetical protein
VLLEFLGLPKTGELLESGLEQSLIENHRRALNILLCGTSFPHKLLTLLRPCRWRIAAW